MVSILFHSFFLQFAKVTGAEFTCAEAEENRKGIHFQINQIVYSGEVVWMVSLDQYVTEDLETHRPLDICVLINFKSIQRKTSQF